MKNIILPFLLACTIQLIAQTNSVQIIPYCYEELTSPDFIQAVEQSNGVCLLPFGILEKHGPHLPLGSDIFQSRAIATAAASQEYSVVYPSYYFGQINEARHQPGTIAYSPELIWKMLQETCDELSRNGLKKIIIVNGHGGNTDFLRYFCMSQLHTPKDYVLIFFQPTSNEAFSTRIKALQQTTYGRKHAGEYETSEMRFIRPDLVKTEQAGSQSGENQARLADFPNQYTGILWYAQYPNHFAGDATKSNMEMGRLLVESDVDQLVKLIKKVKRSNKIEELQYQFYQDAANPLKTKQ